MNEPPDSALSAALRGKPLLAIRGGNFSGRTALLRHFCDSGPAGRIYVGPEVYNALSGLATTVRQEIELHAAAPLEKSGMAESLHVLGLDALIEQHPGLLSGGEQAGLALICGLALRPPNLAIDCSLEQLDHHRLASAIELLQGTLAPAAGTVIADNRLDEWTVEVPARDITELAVQEAHPTPIPGMAPEKLAELPAVSAPAIELRHVSAGYKKRPAVLKDVNVSLKPGVVYSLEGLNGAGKSTCAKVLCGVLRPEAGEVLFDGKLAAPWKNPGRTVAYHLQNPDVGLFESSVLAELCAKSPDLRRPKLMLEVFGLQTVAKANPLSLPFPIRKRISLAATIARPAGWFFLDEPTLGADSTNLAALVKIAQALAARGHGVIAVSHSRKFRELLGGKLLMMENGTIIA
jgi:energy-coupling factor transporter ATP-binding protein EcfA2